MLLNIGDGVVEGAGADTLGAFVIHGSARADRASLVLYFAKTYSTGAVQQTPSSGHVGHVAWSGSDPSDGFFGVWEVTASDTHFELRRGGTCRLVPADNDTYGGEAPVYEPYDATRRGSVVFPAIRR